MEEYLGSAFDGVYAYIPGDAPQELIQLWQNEFQAPILDGFQQVDPHTPDHAGGRSNDTQFVTEQSNGNHNTNYQLNGAYQNLDPNTTIDFETPWGPLSSFKNTEETSGSEPASEPTEGEGTDGEECDCACGNEELTIELLPNSLTIFELRNDEDELIGYWLWYEYPNNQYASVYLHPDGSPVDEDNPLPEWTDEIPVKIINYSNNSEAINPLQIPGALAARAKHAKHVRNAQIEEIDRQLAELNPDEGLNNLEAPYSYADFQAANNHRAETLERIEELERLRDQLDPPRRKAENNNTIANTFFEFAGDLVVSFVPGVGETEDAMILLDPESTNIEKGLVLASSAANYFLPFLPNAAPFIKASRKAAGKVDEVVDTVDNVQDINKCLTPNGGAKRGPKTDINAPHNATIRIHGDLLEAGGNTIIAGGGRLPEKLIWTPGGIKGGRRPDILFETPNGQIRGRNIGKTDRFGNPIKRELEALLDLNGQGILTDFVPYD